ncbi:hypothetical protein [Parafrankia sp. FMc2]|uniref:Vgb family protein n=1 Tax=Parafrankia sp. FMc2 TaxID=3233196 RepID=UPI0034D4DF25
MALAVSFLTLIITVATTTATPAVARDGYDLTEITVASPISQPCNVETAPDGSLWYVEMATRRLGRIDLVTGHIQKFDLPPATIIPVLNLPVPLPGVFPIGPCDMAVGSDGNLWFNDPERNTIGYISMTAPYGIHEITLPTLASVPMSLATGADGNIYVTQTASNQIAKIDIQTHVVTEYNVPTPLSGIIGGTAGQDGAHWFVEIIGNKLLRFDYATQEITEYNVPTPAALPFVIRSYDGQIWFSESGANAIAHFDPTTETFTEAVIPTPASVPIGVTRGVDGYIYTDESVGNKFARIDPATMTVVGEYPLLTPATWNDEIKTGSDGALYSPEFTAGKIARLWLPSFGTDPGFPQNGGTVTGATNLFQDTLAILRLGG